MPVGFSLTSTSASLAILLLLLDVVAFTRKPFSTLGVLRQHSDHQDDEGIVGIPLEDLSKRPRTVGKQPKNGTYEGFQIR